MRSRYEDPLGDIGRAARQRQFLGALMKQAATPSTVLIPWRYKAFADASAGGLAVGTETGFFDAVRVLQAMRAVSNDEGLSLSVPTSDLSYPTNAGTRGQVGHRARQGALRRPQGRRAADRAARRHRADRARRQLTAVADTPTAPPLPAALLARAARLRLGAAAADLV